MVFDSKTGQAALERCQKTFILSFGKVVGPPGIEPGLYAPEAHVLPVYYGPLPVH